MPGDVSKVPRNHQDRGPPGEPDSPTAKKAKENKPKRAANMPSAAATTQGQLRALEKDERALEGATSCNKALTIEQSPKSQALRREGTDNPTIKTTLDKDTAGRKMMNWEYLMWLHHDSSMAGHPGPKHTLELLTRSPNFTRSTELACRIENYVRACIVCAQGKPMRQKPYGLLQLLPIPSRPWQVIAVDFIIKLLPSKDSSEPGNPKYNLTWVVMDQFTKMAYFLPYREDTRVNILARGFLKDIFANYGLPQLIVLDRGSVFAAKFTKALYKALDVKRNLLTAFHPRTDGQTKRTNQTLEQYLRMYCNHLQNNWADLLPMASFAYNNRILASTGHNPFFLNYGYHSRHNMTPDAAKQIPATKEYLMKLDNKKLGPFMITGKVGTLARRLELPATMKIHPVFYISLQDPFQGNAKDPRINRSDPIKIDREMEYKVEKILESRIDGRGKSKRQQYLVKWKGYSSSNNT